MTVETIYELYLDDEAKAKGAVPELASQIVAVDLSNPADAQLILANSARLWEKNISEPFIADYSQVDENGKMVGIKKSMQELGAQIVEVSL